MQGIAQVTSQSPLRHMVTPGGYTMSVAMTNCGALGWTTDQHGYLYAPVDPQTRRPWPEIPAAFRCVVPAGQRCCGIPGLPTGCLFDQPLCTGAKLSLHQDKDEPDLRAPIVSVSLGLPAIFQFGGLKRNDPLQRLILEHGDIVVWGGESRLYYHGIAPLKTGYHPITGECRYNLTFRHASNSE